MTPEETHPEAAFPHSAPPVRLLQAPEEGWTDPQDRDAAHAVELLRQCYESPEHAEAIRAFAEKRAPKFR